MKPVSYLLYSTLGSVAAAASLTQNQTNGKNTSIPGPKGTSNTFRRLVTGNFQSSATCSFPTATRRSENARKNENPLAPRLLTSKQENGIPSSLPQNETVATAPDPYGEDAPITNVTRKYNLTITRGYKQPDGFNKSMILIDANDGNGTRFPGPTIEANWGDTFEITVNNQIKSAAEEEGTILHEEGTSIHWHGMLQKHNESILGGAVGPWFDGVPSVGQCPIAPGSSFTYRFIANPYGTSWYHSHYSAQYADGLFGAMIVHGFAHLIKYVIKIFLTLPRPNLTLSDGADKSSPQDALYDIDLGPVILVR